MNRASQNQQLEQSEMNAHEYDNDTLCEDNGTTVLEGVSLDSLLQDLWVYLTPSDNDKLKTKLATAIAKVIGISDDLKSLIIYERI